MDKSLTRRRLVAGAAAAAGSRQAAAQATYWQITPDMVRRHDESVARLLSLQTTDPASPWRGGYPDATGLHHGGSASGLVHACVCALVQPRSKYHGDPLLAERIRLAAGYLNRKVSPDGNYDLLTTNFNSPPDTAFMMLGLASAAFHARQHGQREISGLLEPILKRCGRAMAAGGVHTPNHRWVVCEALAQVNELYPDPAYPRRINQWLAEGIDIDPDGQYTERSTVTYNGITNRALTVMAIKLKRPELLEPVRRNLEAMLYLLHSGGEVVTEISRRQDQYQRGGLASYWLALRYLAVTDRNPVYEALARRFPGSLSELMEYPELSRPGPEPVPPPEDYEKHFPVLKVARIRRGLTSATLLLEGNSRFFGVRRGDAVVNSVRFAAAFFGKGQFVPQQGEKRGASWELRQALDAGYYQPFDPPRKVSTEEWDHSRPQRRRTEVCRLDYSATVTERSDGFLVRIRASGTNDVPVAVEINLREGGRLEGCAPAPQVEDGYLLASGYASYRAGEHGIRIGPGRGEHSYTQVRGAQPKLAGPSVYVTGYTPFDHTLEFTWL